MSKKAVVAVVLVVVLLALVVCGGGAAWWYLKNHRRVADIGVLPGSALALPADTALIGGFDAKAFFASPSYKQIASGDIPAQADKSPQELEANKKQIREGLEKGLAEAETKTGIRFDRDLDRVVIAVSNVAAPTPEVAAIAFGRFDAAKIRSAVEASAKAEATEVATKTIAGASVQVVARPGQPSAALAVVDSERLVIGTEAGVSAVLTNDAAHQKPLEANASLFALVKSIDPASSYWLAIDQALVTRAQKQATGDTPPPVPLPQTLTLFGTFEGGLTLAADMADDAAAKTVTEQLEGGLGMLKGMAEGNPDIQKVQGAKAVIDSISIKAAGKRVTLGIGGTGGASLGGVIAALAMPSLMKTQAMLEGTGAMAVPTGNATPEPQAEAPVAQEAPSEATPTPRPATRPAPRATPRRAPPVAQAPPTTEAPAPAPTPRGPVRVGGDIQEPKKIKHVNPAYPETAKRARAQGMVILECNISTEGRVTDVKVLRGVPLLDQAAIDAVRQWVYTPTLLNGTPVPVVMTVTVNFRLN